MKQLRAVVPYARPYRTGIVLGLLLVVVSNGFGILLPYLVGAAIDDLGRSGITTSTIHGYAALIVLTAILAGAARYGMRELLNGISRRVETDLRDDFFARLLQLDAAFFARHRTGDLMSRATNDIQAVRMAIGPGVMYLVNTLVLTGFALAFMLRVSPRLTALALIPMAAMPPAVLLFGRLIHHRFEGIQDHLGRLTTLVQENLSGMRIVRAYRQEAAQEREFDELNRIYLRRNMGLAHITGVFHPLLTFMAGAGMVIVLWVGGRQVIAGAITIGDFVAFGFYLAMLIWPMIALGWVINLFQRGAASMNRVSEVLRASPRVAEPERPARLARIHGEVEFREVSFRYPDTDRDVLRRISFRIPAGSTAALVGPTGAGKSTVVALLARLYDPSGGEVLLDGVPLPSLSLASLRAALGIVPQDAFVFSEQIRDNVAFALPDVMDPAAAAGAVDRAVAASRLDEAIALFPAGLDTRLGERGINLSGGQRQRATLARALVRDPRVLVLDDALSAVDTHTEAEILARLRAVFRERTTLIVSHRVTAVMDAELILVLDGGEIVERGTHQQLLERGGVYATLLRRQLLEEDLAAAGDQDPLARPPGSA
jgi:ATP-binding cassette, subfamily B, multidrug efflux pump